MEAKLQRERAEMDRMVQEERNEMDRMVQHTRDEMDQKIEMKRMEVDMKMQEEQAAADRRLKQERAATDRRFKQERDNICHILQQERENMDREVKQEREIVDQNIKLARVQMDMKTMDARAEMDQRTQHKSDDIDRKAVLPLQGMTEKSQVAQQASETHQQSIANSRRVVVMEFIVHKGFSGAKPGTMTFVEPSKVEWWTMLENLAYQGYKGNTDLYYLKPGYEPPNGLVLLYCSEQLERLLHDHEGRKTCHLYIVKKNATTSTSDDSSSEQVPSYDLSDEIISDHPTRWANVEDEQLEDEEDSGGSVKRSMVAPTDAD